MKVKHDSQYISYILENDTHFFLTGYRVLKKQEKKGLLPCYQIRYNGSVKLLYPISGYTPLSVCAEGWEPEEVIGYTQKLLKSLKEIRDNGFLQLETVDVDSSHIFVDAAAKKLYLVALPITLDGESGSRRWAEALRKTLLLMIELSAKPDSPMLRRMRKGIKEGMLSLENLTRMLGEIVEKPGEEINTERLKKLKENFDRRIRLSAADPSMHWSLVIDKDEFVLGKNPAVVDGLVDLSGTISRIHCKITREESGYFIQDLNSKNHTYVNKMQLLKDEKRKIVPGDLVQMADISFKVEEEN